MGDSRKLERLMSRTMHIDLYYNDSGNRNMTLCGIDTDSDEFWESKDSSYWIKGVCENTNVKSGVTCSRCLELLPLYEIKFGLKDL